MAGNLENEGTVLVKFKIVRMDCVIGQAKQYGHKSLQRKDREH